MSKALLQPLTLVLGKMPREADPAKVIAAGPGVLPAGKIFSEWENRYRFAPEPLEKWRRRARVCGQGLPGALRGQHCPCRKASLS